MVSKKTWFQRCDINEPNLNWLKKNRFLEAIGPRKLPRPSDPRVSTFRADEAFGEVKFLHLFTPRNSNVPGGLGDAFQLGPGESGLICMNHVVLLKVYIYI